MTADARVIGADLAAVVGEAHVRTGAGAAAFAIDGRAPRWAVSPGAVAEVSRCLALAAAHGLAVAPTGRGTRRHWGNPPRALDLVLSLDRLDRVLHHEPADLTVSVEAGIRLQALNATLRPHRQGLPLDPPRAGDSTIGGLIATAASGPYRARYGTPRELLLGVSVVQADGTPVKGGGQVVKNATGYDMPKLHVGALGTLGVVVSAHLRLHPLPAAEASWLFGFPSAEGVLEAALGVMDTPLVPSRLELVDGATLVALGYTAPPPAALAVTIGSVAEGVRAQGERLTELCRRGGGLALPLDEADAWWTQLGDSAAPAEGEAGLGLRIGVRPTDVVKALRAVEAAAAGAASVRATAELANGVLHVVLAGPGVADAPSLVSRLRAGLAPLDGTCVVEHVAPRAKAGLDVWGDVGPVLPLMRRLKDELDPRGILNPGRYVGGI